MTQILLFLFVVVVGFYYAFKYGEKAKKDIIEFQNMKNQNQIIVLKYFGEINLSKTEEYIDVSVDINGNEVSLYLNFVEEEISKKTIESITDLLNELPKMEEVAHQYIISDLKEGGTVKDYIEHHLEEFSIAELKLLSIENADAKDLQIRKFLDQIHLKRIGFYLEESDSIVIFDYTINDDLTQYIIVVTFDSRGGIIDINMES